VSCIIRDAILETRKIIADLKKFSPLSLLPFPRLPLESLSIFLFYLHPNDLKVRPSISAPPSFELQPSLHSEITMTTNLGKDANSSTIVQNLERDSMIQKREPQLLEAFEESNPQSERSSQWLQSRDSSSSPDPFSPSRQINKQSDQNRTDQNPSSQDQNSRTPPKAHLNQPIQPLTPFSPFAREFVSKSSRSTQENNVLVSSSSRQNPRNVDNQFPNVVHNFSPPNTPYVGQSISAIYSPTGAIHFVSSSSIQPPPLTPISPSLSRRQTSNPNQQFSTNQHCHHQSPNLSDSTPQNHSIPRSPILGRGFQFNHPQTSPLLKHQPSLSPLMPNSHTFNKTPSPQFNQSIHTTPTSSPLNLQGQFQTSPSGSLPNLSVVTVKPKKIEINVSGERINGNPSRKEVRKELEDRKRMKEQMIKKESLEQIKLREWEEESRTSMDGLHMAFQRMFTRGS